MRREIKLLTHDPMRSDTHDAIEFCTGDELVDRIIYEIRQEDKAYLLFNCEIGGTKSVNELGNEILEMFDKYNVDAVYKAYKYLVEENYEDEVKENDFYGEEPFTVEEYVKDMIGTPKKFKHLVLEWSNRKPGDKNHPLYNKKDDEYSKLKIKKNIKRTNMTNDKVIKQLKKDLDNMWIKLGNQRNEILKSQPEDPYTATHKQIHEDGKAEGLSIAMRMLEPWIKNAW